LAVSDILNGEKFGYEWNGLFTLVKLSQVVLFDVFLKIN